MLLLRFLHNYSYKYRLLNRHEGYEAGLLLSLAMQQGRKHFRGELDWDERIRVLTALVKYWNPICVNFNFYSCSTIHGRHLSFQRTDQSYRQCGTINCPYKIGDEGIISRRNYSDFNDINGSLLNTIAARKANWLECVFLKSKWSDGEGKRDELAMMMDRTFHPLLKQIDSDSTYTKTDNTRSDGNSQT